MQAEILKTAAIETVFANMKSEMLEKRRASDWRYAKIAADKPRSYELQTLIPTEYKDPLVYRALNQRDWANGHTAQLLVIEEGGANAREITGADWAEARGYKIERTPMKPLSAAEEMAVCRKLIRAFAHRLQAMENNRWLASGPQRDKQRQLIRTEIVRYFNAKFALENGLSNVSPYIADSIRRNAGVV